MFKSGADGLLNQDQVDTPYIPRGTSWWELSTQTGVEKKANYDYTKKTAEHQQAAIRSVFEDHGPAPIADIAVEAEIPRSVGVATGLGLDRDPALDLALQHLGSTTWKLREFARGTISGLYSIDGWQLI